jgi:hypothetical protein
MMKWHGIWIFALGFLIAYYFRGLGDMTIGKLYKPA